MHFPGNHTIGIIGAGHLGRSLAETLVDVGFPKDRLLLSHAGSPATRAAVIDAGLEKNLIHSKSPDALFSSARSDNLADNTDLCRRSSVIFITIPPQAVASLDNLTFPRNALVVSCMAGIPRAVPEQRWGIDVVRMMPGGPDTILRHKGIAGIFPDNEVLAHILVRMGMQVQVLPDEETMHIFTAGVCFTAAILACRAMGRNPDNEIAGAVREYPLFTGMYAWAQEVLPGPLSGAERDEYIAKMSTPGGITEAVVRSIRSGNPLSAAMQAGIDRSRAISRDAEEKFLQ
ncbi:MAG: NAD(P)-binding domain-containing protein [Methanoregula sp.]|nr:NAD(P)-binding domain-containing protein [Methanoregula sp.]